MRKAVTLLGWLALLWLLLSGPYSTPGASHFHPLVAVLGGAACLAVVCIHQRMERVHGDATSYRAVFRVPLYLPWLFGQIVLSALSVSRIILSPRLPVSPRMVRITTPPVSDFGAALYANSITLTPGTLSLDVRARTILVHALSEDTARDLMEGEMGRRVARLDGCEPGGAPTTGERGAETEGAG